MTDAAKVCTTSGEPPRYPHGTASAPDDIDPATGQHRSYWVLCAEERERGFVRPVRHSYQHLTCGTITTMGTALAETYARDPSFYGATFCVACRTHLPVGPAGTFVWVDETTGHVTAERVGT